MLKRASSRLVSGDVSSTAREAVPELQRGRKGNHCLPWASASDVCRTTEVPGAVRYAFQVLVVTSHDPGTCKEA